MNNYTSSIRRIGLINSGMFDTLSLNFDVQAIHLVGANNVGKTSLIALIQFLFFPTINEMTFIKSTGESMGFYFRREGSYLLFEVRTVTGSIRTVGVYGTGESDSRINFVFNGSFDISDFLDEDQIPIPLQKVQSAFFSRDFARFDKFERYEEALLGLHTRGEYNVPMFALSKTNFRLLRKLMQGLLRLDRIDAADVQQFLIRIVERGAVKTRFNLLQDFEQKYRHINQLRIALNELEALKPLFLQYQRILSKIAEKEIRQIEHAERLYHLSSVYHDLLVKEEKSLALVFQKQEEKLESSGVSVKKWNERIGTLKSMVETLENEKNRFESLLEKTRNHSEALVKNERDTLTHARVKLQNALSDAKMQDIGSLKSQFSALQREHKAAVGRLSSDTLRQVWANADFNDAHFALLDFLVSKELSGLDATSAVANQETFISASARVVEDLDSDGNYNGFGLNIPRSVWFVSEKDREPPQARVERLARAMEDIRTAIDIAQNIDKQQRELDSLDAAIMEKEKILNRFAALQEIIAHWKDPAAVNAEIKKNKAECKRLQRAVAKKEDELRLLRQKQHRIHSDLQTIRVKREEVGRAHERIQHFETEPTSIFRGMSLDALSSEYGQVGAELNEIVKSLVRLHKELDEPKSELEARYERSAPDIPFERWLEQKSNLAEEIEGLESQLQREYDGIFTVVRAKLTKITQAYENVQSQVAALNKGIRNVRISNIEQICISIEKTDLLDAIDQSSPGQMDLFGAREPSISLEQAHTRVEEYFNRIRNYGSDINLQDMFRLQFSVQFGHQDKPVERYEIHRFESNGTETGVKIVIYLGLIGLLQERKNAVGSRIPFFLDEVGSIDSNNLNQLINYCTRNNFLPIFASPEIRKDISHNYLFRRNGSRSHLASIIKVTKRPSNEIEDASTRLVDNIA